MACVWPSPTQGGRDRWHQRYHLGAYTDSSGEIRERESLCFELGHSLHWSQVFISLYFGTTEGEGGSFALYQGLYPAAKEDFDADRTLTGESQDQRLRPLSEHSRSFKDRIRLPLLLWVRLLSL